MERTDDQLIYEIIQSARAVHQGLGPGFIESVYNRAFALELKNRGLAVEREKLVRVRYADCVVGRHFLDLLVEDRAIVELKAARAIVPLFEVQMGSYLTATEYTFGLIINFGVTDLEWKRVTRSGI